MVRNDVHTQEGQGKTNKCAHERVHAHARTCLCTCIKKKNCICSSNETLNKGFRLIRKTLTIVQKYRSMHTNCSTCSKLYLCLQVLYTNQYKEESKADHGSPEKVKVVNL